MQSSHRHCCPLVLPGSHSHSKAIADPRVVLGSKERPWCHQRILCAPSQGGKLAGAPGCALTLCFWVPGDVLPSANVGLPSPLVPRQPPQPAYVTHTGPLVQMLLQQDQLGRARSGWPAEPQHHGDHRDAGAQEQTPVRGRRGSAAGTEKDSMRIPKEKSSWTPPGVCHRIVFARKPSLTVPPQSSLACSSKRE